MGLLDVIVRPDITEVIGDNDAVVEGSVAKLTCEANGVPKPKIYWTREGPNNMIMQWDKHGREKIEGF